MPFKPALFQTKCGFIETLGVSMGGMPWVKGEKCVTCHLFCCCFLSLLLAATAIAGMTATTTIAAIVQDRIMTQIVAATMIYLVRARSILVAMSIASTHSIKAVLFSSDQDRSRSICAIDVGCCSEFCRWQFLLTNHSAAFCGRLVVTAD